jgi:hypothetical protein
MAIFYLPEVEFLQMHAETNRKNSATENSIVTASAYILAIDQGTTAPARSCSTPHAGHALNLRWPS